MLICTDDDDFTAFLCRPEPRAGYLWEMDKLGEWVPATNVTEGGMQYQHAVWSGIRYTPSTDANVDASADGLATGSAVAATPQATPKATATAAPATLFVGTLDAGCACPVLNREADPTLTPESALAKACFKYKVDSAADPGVDQQLKASMIDGMGVNLHANLFTISGYPQWVNALPLVPSYEPSRAHARDA